MTVQRYEMVWATRAGQTFEELQRNDDGAWCRYEEVQAELERLRTALTAVEEWAHGACPLFDSGQLASKALRRADQP